MTPHRVTTLCCFLCLDNKGTISSASIGLPESTPVETAVPQHQALPSATNQLAGGGMYQEKMEGPEHCPKVAPGVNVGKKRSQGCFDLEKQHGGK